MEKPLPERASLDLRADWFQCLGALQSAPVAVRKEDLRRIGGFDASLPGDTSPFLDLFVRLRIAGVEAKTLPIEASALILPHKQSKDNPEFRLEDFALFAMRITNGEIFPKRGIPEAVRNVCPPCSVGTGRLLAEHLRREQKAAQKQPQA